MDRQVLTDLKRLRDAWMDMLPMSTMREERRQTKYLADVTQENAERQRGNATALDPNLRKAVPVPIQ